MHAIQFLFLAPQVAAAESWPSFDSLSSRPRPPGAPHGVSLKMPPPTSWACSTSSRRKTLSSAAREIKTSVRASLDWSLDLPRQGFFGRPPLPHTIAPLGSNAFGDNITDNMRGGSQWGGLRHYQYVEGPL